MRRIAVVLVLAAMLALVTVSAASAGGHRTVRISGHEQFVPNAKVMATLRFTPGPLRVSPGTAVTWVNNTDEPHTITIVSAGDIPTSIDEVFNCGAPGGPCSPALAGHFDFSTNPPTLIAPVLGGGADGTAGLDGVGDSLVVFPGGSVTASVTAPAGKTLHYLCAIHPWMIGTIRVH